MEGRRGGFQKRFQFLATSLKRFAAEIAVAFAKQIEEHDRRGNFLRQHLHPRCGRMNAKLQRFEIEAAGVCDDDLTVEDASIRPLRTQRDEQFGKVSIQ